MTAATETGLIAVWLSSILTADTGAGGVFTLSTGGIHQGSDPTGNKTYPKTIFRYQGGSPLHAVGAKRRVYVNAVYAVYGIWQIPSYTGVLDALAARIDFLLEGQQGIAVGNGLLLGCTNVGPIEMESLSNGVSISMLGAQYRIYSQQPPQSS